MFYTSERPIAPVGPLIVTSFSHDSVSLSWKPPIQDLAYISSYRIETRESTKSTWETVGTVDASATSYIVRNLKSSTEYFFRVIAEGSTGASKPLMIDTSVVPRLQYGEYIAPS